MLFYPDLYEESGIIVVINDDSGGKKKRNLSLWFQIVIGDRKVIKRFCRNFPENVRM